MKSRSRSVWALSLPIRAYRVVSFTRPRRCRFWPSCSEYALEALEFHGALRGGVLALRRLARCHPWGGRGVDPIPPSAAPAGGPRAELR